MEILPLPPNSPKTAVTPRKRVIMARKTTLEKADRSFDLEFWQRMGSRARFAAAWQMVNEFRVIRGLHGRQPRLQRSVTRIQQRGS
jgi:hypothetical protein